MATTLIVLNSIIGRLTYKFKWLEVIIEGKPLLIIHNGKLNQESMKKAKLTHHELMAALRQQGCTEIEEVKFASLENNGEISVHAQSKK